MSLDPFLLHLDVREGHASALLTDGWLQGRTAYGGWQAALGLAAMRTLVPEDAALRSLQVNFIAPVPVGTVEARATLLRTGRSASQAEARIDVDGQVAMTAVGIFGKARPSALEQVLEASQAPAPEDCAELPRFADFAPAFTRNMHIRWAGGYPPYSGAPRGEMSLWARFREQGIADEVAFVGLADTIPPSPLPRFQSPVAASSMNWTLEILRSLTGEEREGWLRFDSVLHAAREGYGWQTATLSTERGGPVALSRQCVAVFG